MCISNAYKHGYNIINNAEPLDMLDVKDCVVAFTVKTTPQYAMKHGACKISDTVNAIPHNVV